MHMIIRASFDVTTGLFKLQWQLITGLRYNYLRTKTPNYMREYY